MQQVIPALLVSEAPPLLTDFSQRLAAPPPLRARQALSPGPFVFHFERSKADGSGFAY